MRSSSKLSRSPVYAIAVCWLFSVVAGCRDRSPVADPAHAIVGSWRAGGLTTFEFRPDGTCGWAAKVGLPPGSGSGSGAQVTMGMAGTYSLVSGKVQISLQQNILKSSNKELQSTMNGMEQEQPVPLLGTVTFHGHDDIDITWRAGDHTPSQVSFQRVR